MPATITTAQLRELVGAEAAGRLLGAAPGGSVPVVAPEAMNRTEAAYARELDLLYQAGRVLWWRFEPWSLRLAPGTFYRPDFVVVVAPSASSIAQSPDRQIARCPPHGGLECHEVKGVWRGQGKAHWEDDARAKVKVAAAMFPWMRFVGMARTKDGRWQREEF